MHSNSKYFLLLSLLLFFSFSSALGRNRMSLDTNKQKGTNPHFGNLVVETQDSTTTYNWFKLFLKFRDLLQLRKDHWKDPPHPTYKLFLSLLENTYQHKIPSSTGRMVNDQEDYGYDDEPIHLFPTKKEIEKLTQTQGKMLGKEQQGERNYSN